MTSTVDNWVLVAVMSIITIMLRAVPILMPRSVLRKRWMLRLNQELPLSVMLILVMHSLAEPDVTTPLMAEVVTLIAVAATYWRWRNALLSVVFALVMLALIAPMIAA